MSISYSNKLRDSVRTKFHSRYSLTDTQRNMLFTNYSFIYGILLDWNDLEEQAYLFSDMLISQGWISGTRTYFANNLTEAKQWIARAYIWSYYKSLYYSYTFSLQYRGGFRVPQNSKVFYGHRVLYDNICAGLMTSTDLADSFHILMQFDVDSTMLKFLTNYDFEKKEISKSKTTNYVKIVESVAEQAAFDPTLDQFICFCTKTQTITSPKCEAILQQLFEGIRQIELIDLDSDLLSLTSNIGINPLGNLAYQCDKETEIPKDVKVNIRYIEDISIMSDKVSYFWGKACCVKVTSEPTLDSNDSIYSDVDKKQYDPINIAYEIKSITGFDIYDTSRSDISTYNRNKGIVSSPKPRNGGNPNNGNPPSNPGSGSGPLTVPRGGGFPPVNQGPSGPPALGKIVSKVINIPKKAFRQVKDVGQVILESDKPYVIAIIEELYNFKMSRSQKRELTGKTYSDVARQYALPDRFASSDGNSRQLDSTTGRIEYKASEE